MMRRFDAPGNQAGTRLPPLTNSKTHNHKMNRAEKASHKIDSKNST